MTYKRRKKGNSKTMPVIQSHEIAAIMPAIIRAKGTNKIAQIAAVVFHFTPEPSAK